MDLTRLSLAAPAIQATGPLAPEEPIETRGGDTADKILVTSWGHYRGEALAMIERIA